MSVSTLALVHAEPLIQGTRLPLLVEPATTGVDLAGWLSAHRGEVDQWLVEHGGILFRGFDVASAAAFHSVVAACSTGLMDYAERSSPRTLVQEHVYTSTDYPSDQSIFPHNEHSYANRFPAKIAFFCLVPPIAGGETPVVDCRRVLDRIPLDIQRRFHDRGGWMYVRNFTGTLGLSWHTAFQTSERKTVEQYCRENRIQCEWKSDDWLKTIQVRPVTVRHPRTREEIWFNHATFFNVGTLPAVLRDTLLQLFPTEDLPNNTYYGDGSPYEAETLRILQEAYVAEQMIFPWRRGDVLLLDNMLTAHARNPFEGERRILVSMADPIERSSLPA